MKQILYVFLLIYPFLCWSQREITVGPYEDCKQLKEGRNQINTRSEWFNLGGVSELNIWTLQHDTFDKSRIYDENGNLIWEWAGDSSEGGFYQLKQHTLKINALKIKVEFYQGTEPWCGGQIMVENLSNKTVSKPSSKEVKKTNFINNFPNSKLSEVTVENKALTTIFQRKFEDVFNEIVKMTMFQKSKQSKETYLNDKIKELTIEIEGILGGKMTGAQKKEFYAVGVNAKNFIQSVWKNQSNFSMPSMNSNEASNFQSKASSTSSSHSYKVIISWDNPVASNTHQRPTAQNGVVEYFSERSGSYQVKPICPKCSKKQYNTISGFAAGKDSKIVTINCN